MITSTYSVKTVEITPDQASEWLGGNVRNRPISQKVVDKYAADMAAGLWRDNNTAIAFDVQSTLIDGQHRLWAIIESGCTVRMIVATGMEPDAIEVLGDVHARSDADQHNIVGHPADRDVNVSDLTTLRAMVGGMEGSWRKRDFREEHALVMKHAQAVQFAVDHVRSVTRGIGRAYVRAVIARAWYSADRDDLKRFGRILSSGMPDSPADALIVRLRNQLIAAENNLTMQAQRVMYRKTERVLANWLRGRQATLIRPVNREQFPLPEEVKS